MAFSVLQMSGALAGRLQGWTLASSEGLISHPPGGECYLLGGISLSFPYASALVVCMIYVSIWDMVYFLLFDTVSY